MTADYQLAESAENDLREILRYVAEKDGVDRALHVQVRFVEAFEMLAMVPGAESTRPHHRRDTLVDGLPLDRFP